MKTLKTHGRALTSLLCIGVIAILAVLTVVADTPQPVLRIALAAPNQYQITITNGVSTETYVLYWAPEVTDATDTWPILTIGTTGQTNFTVDVGDLPAGFFRVAFGTDWDGDGIPNWQDANAANSSIGILNITIDSPTNLANLN